MTGVPTVDVSALRGLATGTRPGAAARAAAAALDRACHHHGFVTVVGHGIATDLTDAVLDGARALFALPLDQRRAVSMAAGGRAWRGWFPLGGELTAGRPDGKEGFYLGEDLDADDPRVLAERPLHGPNLLPEALPGLRAAVRRHLDAMTALGQDLLAGLAVGLGLDQRWFVEHLTAEPTLLLRFFRYPPTDDEGWGVAEHTDYGLLTILLQDGTPGLEVHGPEGWVAVPAEPGSLVCNLGDVLEVLTGGRYRSTPHRVRNATGADRISVPFFLDPSWDAVVTPLPIDGPAAPGRARWDGLDDPAPSGTYGEHLVAKVARVFPALAASLPAPGGGRP